VALQAGIKLVRGKGIRKGGPIDPNPLILLSRKPPVLRTPFRGKPEQIQATGLLYRGCPQDIGVEQRKEHDV
jgi:hypothetical protein